MIQTWRWFGPRDPISLTKIRQAGASGVVTALYDLPPGQIWSAAAIGDCQQKLAQHGLCWSVVESLPVHTDVRLGLPNAARYVDAYRQSLRNLAACGVRTVCYNFMPVIDWTRTSLNWRDADGSLSLRFDAVEWTAFDVFILCRRGADADYSATELAAAEQHYAQLSEAERMQLSRNIAAGLPGANEDGHDLASLRAELARWEGVSATTLRGQLIWFLEQVIEECEQLGMCLALHPDDPPRPLLGLPRIASCATDFQALFDAVPSMNNGMTLCVGSLGAGKQNAPAVIARDLASRVMFAHLRAVRLEPDGSFVEADHLHGDVDLVDVVRTLVAEERRRRDTEHPQSSIPFRPDHGKTLEGDIADLPGYSWLGRLKALAELRGVVSAVEKLT